MSTLIGIVVFMTVSGVFWMGFFCGLHYFPKKKKKKSKKIANPCDCLDVNQCSKSCHAMELFIKDARDGKV
jgi:hypothetical protein